MGPKSRRHHGAIRAGLPVFVRPRTLVARLFDAAKLQTTGDAAPIGEPVDSAVPTLDLPSLSTTPLNPSDQRGLLC